MLTVQVIIPFEMDRDIRYILSSDDEM